ncbi:MAG: glutamate-1-semialdehyde 2,1-aminomutase [Planctomycetes bacterium]|nr:glutamate-1-semialdehyde 2,1-aminomutase [Planctomycetota bacterium]
MNTAQSTSLYRRASEVMPGGVSSPVRAFRAVGGNPIFVTSASGATITDVDGNSYIDYVGSWGPMIWGHGDPEVAAAVARAIPDGLSFGAPCEAEVRMAETVTRMAPVEMVRMVNSGTEAVLAAVRLARGVTGRNAVVKFSGCYHGHADSMLVKAGSGALTGGVPDSAGVTPGVAGDTLTARYNDRASLEALRRSRSDIAAVIVEPVAANMGVVPPAPGFLEEVRRFCDAVGAVLIFDEVITGFRLAAGGAQERFGIRADLVVYGKIIGGGLPVGAYAGRRDLMEQVAPLGPVYQAGTLSGNPVAMAAGLAQLEKLERHPEVYDRLEQLAERLADGLTQAAATAGVPVRVNRSGSLVCCYFSHRPVVDLETAQQADTAAYARFFTGMLARGIYLAPSQFEAMFVSAAHTPAAIDQTVAAALATLREMTP